MRRFSSMKYAVAETRRIRRSQKLGFRSVVTPREGPVHRAIFESGAIRTETPLSIAETKGTAFAAAAGWGSGTDSATAKCLRSLTAAQVESLAGNGVTYDSNVVTGSSAYVTGLITDGQILPLPARAARGSARGSNFQSSF
jgi:para-nitrobenzyl esterase